MVVWAPRRSARTRRPAHPRWRLAAWIVVIAGMAAIGVWCLFIAFADLAQ